MGYDENIFEILRQRKIRPCDEGRKRYDFLYISRYEYEGTSRVQISVGGSGEDCGVVDVNEKEIADLVDALIKIQNGEI